MTSPTMPYTNKTTPSINLSYSFFSAVKKKISYVSSGITNLVKRVIEIVRKHPLQAITLSGSVALGHSLVQGNTAIIIASVVTGINIVCMGRNLVRFANSMTFTHFKKSNTVIKRICTVAIVIICVYSLSTVPIAHAHAACQGLTKKAIDPATDCLREGRDLKTCFDKVTQPGFKKSAFEFTVHESEAISNVELDSQKICYSVALNKTASAIKVCFKDLNYPQDRSVEFLPHIDVTSQYADMPPGFTIRYITVKGKTICGTFSSREVSELTSEPTMCILSSLRQNATTLQTCLNPSIPSHVTVKPMENVYIVSQDEEPIARVTTNPEMLGLNPHIEEVPYCCDDPFQQC